MPRRKKEKVDIDVVPYLSIMVIVLKLICLILIVCVMQIALNPHGLKVVTFAQLYAAREVKEKDQKDGQFKGPKQPTYIECRSDGLSVFPGNFSITPNEIGENASKLVTVLDKIAKNNKTEYVILIIRPRSTAIYRATRRMLAARDIDVGYDVMEEATQIDWAREMKKVGLDIQGTAQ